MMKIQLKLFYNRGLRDFRKNIINKIFKILTIFNNEIIYIYLFNSV